MNMNSDLIKDNTYDEFISIGTSDNIIINVSRDTIKKSPVLYNILNLSNEYSNETVDIDKDGNYLFFTKYNLNYNSIKLILIVLEYGLKDIKLFNFINQMDEKDFLNAKSFADEICIDIPLKLYIYSYLPNSKADDIYNQYQFLEYYMDETISSEKLNNHKILREYLDNDWIICSQKYLDKNKHKTLIMLRKKIES